MKRTRQIFIALMVFVLGYLAHVAVVAWRESVDRADMASYLQREFPVGDDAEKVEATLKERGYYLKFNESSHRYYAPIQLPGSAKSHLVIDVDQNRRIRSITVVRSFIP